MKTNAVILLLLSRLLLTDALAAPSNECKPQDNPLECANPEWSTKNEVTQAITAALSAGGHDGRSLSRNPIYPSAALGGTAFAATSCKNDAIVGNLAAQKRVLWALKCRYITKQDAVRYLLNVSQQNDEWTTIPAATVSYPIFGTLSADAAGLPKVGTVWTAPKESTSGCELPGVQYGIVGACNASSR